MKNITQPIKVVALALMLSVGISYVFAWTTPTLTPPNGNVASPLNVGNTAQTKTGDLGLGRNLISANSFGFFAKNSVGTDEQWMWPRYSDNTMYTNFGANGWSIRNNTSNNVMFMKNDGNVGIGTVNPATKLDIIGNNTGVGGMRIKTVSSGANTSPVAVQFNNDLGDAAVGASGTRYLEVDYLGNFRIERPQSVSATPDLNITPAGNVGIGTTMPAQKLEVAGNIKASGTICDGSNNCVGAGGSVASYSNLPTGAIAGYYSDGGVVVLPAIISGSFLNRQVGCVSGWTLIRTGTSSIWTGGSPGNGVPVETNYYTCIKN